MESSFGKLKEIEGDQSRSGFTSSIVIWAALFGATTATVIRDAMTQVSGKLVQEWVSNSWPRQMGCDSMAKPQLLRLAFRKPALLAA